MQHITDVLVIGGGVIGTSIAYNLRKLGSEVTVLEKGAVGGQASSAAAGLLAPLGPLSGPGPLAALLLAGFSLFPSLVPELEDASGIHLGYEQIGALRAIRNPRRMSHLKKRMEAWRPLGLQMYWLTGDEARQREPLLTSAVCAAIYVPEESQIAAPHVVKAFAKAASNLGATILEHTEVVAIQKEGQKITGVQTKQGETITCKHVVLASGSWSGCYEAWFDLTLPVSPQKGQILSLRAPESSLKHIIFGDAAYIAPRGSSIIVGATKEDVGFDTRVTEEGISWLYDTATRFIPVLQTSAREAAWAGLRPCTPDRWPILGPVPHWANLTLATGHNSVGIILSPLTGNAIAESIVTGQVPEIIRPFSLERFQRIL